MAKEAFSQPYLTSTTLGFITLAVSHVDLPSFTREISVMAKKHWICLQGDMR